MRIVSGIQTSGQNGFHLGNYLGAVRNWVDMQSRGECFFFLADLHAITQPISPADLRRNMFDMTAMLMACGIGGNDSTLFSQMMVPQHAELQWMLSCTARMGWLNRMTQFKDKGGSDIETAFRSGYRSGDDECNSAQTYQYREDTAWSEYDRNRPSVGVGLFTYPVLQAADILLYDATHVPVGDDQDQHLQLVRDIADKFNHDYGVDLFVKPEAVMTGPATRVMSLKNGSKKMSKTDPDDMARINILDTPETITKKFRRAVTDTLMLPSEPEGLTGRREVTNLVSIYAALTNDSIDVVLRELGGLGHGVLKQRLADATIAALSPITSEYRRLRGDEDILLNELEHGWEEAQRVADDKMHTVRKTIFGYQ